MRKPLLQFEMNSLINFSIYKSYKSYKSRQIQDKAFNETVV